MYGVDFHRCLQVPVITVGNNGINNKVCQAIRQQNSHCQGLLKYSMSGGGSQLRECSPLSRQIFS